MTVETTRVVDLAGWAECEPLFAHYVEWVVGELGAQGVATRPGQADTVARGFDTDRDLLLGPRGRVYLARLDGSASGVVALKPVDDAVAEVKRLFVTARARGLGVASSLMDAVVADARSLGYARLRLETHRYMTAAIVLYQRLGFVETGPFAGYEGDDYGLGAVTRFFRLDLVAGVPPD